jgi:hypothetical protein
MPQGEGEVTRGSEQHIDTDVRPHWMRTCYNYFPYATWHCGQWWVLRANYCFPGHDLCTLFIDGRAVAGITATINDPRPLVVSIAALDPILPQPAEHVPALPADIADSVVAGLADYVVYGSEFDEPRPCVACEIANRNAYERTGGDSS